MTVNNANNGWHVTDVIINNLYFKIHGQLVTKMFAKIHDFN